ncbi:MAG TPA: GHMP kinase [Nitrospirae bacterium]|nr:D-glycero-alpha-D-manno-heptose 7-phosphate kinase [bacterium BMS3Abin06]HDH12745.1 GHMP kinase [Nitrospirota bacterium]HDZ00054.1 GHMP kinase [Nitrospirota bacterium]
MIISQTPLRISFVGGGTDLKSFYQSEDGMVLSAAIDKYVYVIVKERFDEKIYINYSIKEIVDDVPEIRHELVREAMKKVGIERGVEITTLADVPSEGSGLGSSSSVTVGLLNALYNYAGVQVTLEQIAREACEIEIDICKKPIGKQDQYIAAYGGLNKITFHPDESVSVSRLPVFNIDILILGSRLLLFYTNKTRKADKILKKQKQETEDKREVLREMKNFVPDLEESLKSSQFNKLGKLLHKNWLLKRSLVGAISNSEIDSMYRKAMDAGALGGKICGAGGGGFLLLYVPKDKQDKVRSALRDYRELPFMLDSFGSRIIFNVRRYSTK